MKIAVAGATGRVGSHVVDVLNERGHNVVAMSRSKGVDVVTGKGLAEALTGVDVIIDVSTGPSPEEKAATDFFVAATRNLQQVGQHAGVKRMVVISIVGIDEFASGYYLAKQVQERDALAGPIPARILRATQFHEFVEQLMQWGQQGDVSYVWKMRTQLVAARTVAEALADLATGPDATGPILEIGGPRVESLVDAAQKLAARRGDPKRIEGVSAPFGADLLESGAALPGPDATLAGPTFDEWLDATYPKSATAAR